MERAMDWGQAGSTPWIFWPFVALWRLVATIIEMAGRIVGILLGVILMIVGALLTATIIGAVVGIPLAVFGLLLVVRSLF